MVLRNETVKRRIKEEFDKSRKPKTNCTKYGRYFKHFHCSEDTMREFIVTKFAIFYYGPDKVAEGEPLPDPAQLDLRFLVSDDGDEYATLHCPLCTTEFTLHSVKRGFSDYNIIRHWKETCSGKKLRKALPTSRPSSSSASSSTQQRSSAPTSSALSSVEEPSSAPTSSASSPLSFFHCR